LKGPHEGGHLKKVTGRIFGFNQPEKTTKKNNGRKEKKRKRGRKRNVGGGIGNNGNYM